ncbi:MAG: DUF2513 domain-containing protein [Thermodesulfobacteriota bacterium]
MKRNMDIIRKIILTLRDADKPIDSVPDIPKDDFLAHAELIIEAGLVKGIVQPSGRKQGPEAAILFRLTWEGQDFADAIIEDTLWNKAKENILKPSASWSFAILLEYLRAEIRKRVGL